MVQRGKKGKLFCYSSTKNKTTWLSSLLAPLFRFSWPVFFLLLAGGKCFSPNFQDRRFRWKEVQAGSRTKFSTGIFGLSLHGFLPFSLASLTDRAHSGTI